MIYLQIIGFIILAASIFSFYSLAPWVPTKNKDLERIDEIIKLNPKEKFLEMGCGTARVSLYLAKKYPDSHITGIELSPLFYFISKIKVFFSRAKNIDILLGNALKKDLTRFDVIYVFGLPETITAQVFPLIKDIKNKNFRCISYCFQMKNDIFEETKYKTEKNFSIYEYKNIVKNK